MREPFPATLEPAQFAASIGEEKIASAGDSIFVHGQVGRIEAFEMSAGITSTMPGAYGVPFDFSIDRSQLQGVFQTANHQYFAAPSEASRASHSLVGNVLAQGDSVGMRVSRTTGEHEWYVDNSRYNRSDTVWHRVVKKEDGVEFVPTSVGTIDSQSNLTTITYDGYYSDLLHFTFEVVEGGELEETEFKFDVEEGEITPVNIRGNIFEVLGVDNLGMRYRWVKVSN